MRPSDFKIGETYQWTHDREITITDIEDREYDDGFHVRIIIFDLFSVGIFRERIGWSFHVFYGDNEIDLTDTEEEDYEDDN